MIREDLTSMVRLFEQLKHRNVLRAAAGYAVVAWLTIQVADTVFPLLGVPTWVTTMVVILAIIGFPVTVVVSWIYQWTPAGFITEREAEAAGYTEPVSFGRQVDFVIIVLLVIAVGWLAYDKTIDTAVLDNSIAVLPFVNMSDDPGNEYFADGMSEEILNLLARISDLKVIGRTSSFSFKGRNEDLRVIGQTLGVKTVLEGSVRKSGDRVRITAQLVDVSDGTHIWSQTYDRTMTDIFAVQDDVAAAVIDALRIHVGTTISRGRPTDNLQAYTLFLRARVLLNDHNGREATALLLQATELDPTFAEAYEMLAYSYWTSGGSDIETVEGFALMGEAARKALTVNADLAFAEALYFAAMGPKFDLQTIEALERAVRDQPGNTSSLRLLIYELEYSGYLGEAHRVARRYATVDPLSPVANYSLGESLNAIGQSSEAMVPLTVAYEFDEVFAKWFVPYVNLIAGRDEIAVSQIEADLKFHEVSDTSWVEGLVADARDPFAGLENMDRHYAQILESVSQEDALYVRATLTPLYAALGFIDRYYDMIFAAEPNDQMTNDAEVFFWQGIVLQSKAFVSHPRYLEAAELLGITRTWEQRGAPDFCERVGNAWSCD
jgi:serine/threonine-protein kinase